MALYRHDIQLKVSTDLVATGVYYWTNVWYFLADDPDEVDIGEHYVINGTELMSCVGITGDRRRLVNVDTGSVIFNGNYGYPTYTHWGPIASPITNVLLLWLYAGDEVVGYKRIRMPVPPYAHVNGVLTDSFIADWETSGFNVGGGNLVCNRNRVLVTGSRLDPYVRSWQLRHGTRRAERRYLHP